MDKIKGEYESFLNFPEWDANSPYIRREIRTRWSKADLDDDDKREGHLTTLKSEWDAFQYGRDRALAYMPVENQLDLLWHAIDTENWTAAKLKTTEFYTKLKKVKDDNPK